MLCDAPKNVFDAPIDPQRPRETTKFESMARKTAEQKRTVAPLGGSHGLEERGHVLGHRDRRRRHVQPARALPV